MKSVWSKLLLISWTVECSAFLAGTTAGELGIQPCIQWLRLVIEVLKTLHKISWDVGNPIKSSSMSDKH